MVDVYIDDTVSRIRELHKDLLCTDRSTISIRNYIDRQATRILEAHTDGNTAVIFHLACWCKPLIGQPHEKIMSTPLTLPMARQTIASEHGFSSWQAIEDLGDTAFDREFENCVDRMLAGDIDALKKDLASCPQLLTQQSQYGHQATLLHYIAANGVESYRQVTPLNATEIIELLISSGAEINANANIYGGGVAIDLLTSSAHPRNAGIVDAMVTAFNQQ